ncbi:MFS transporter [Nostocoides sp. F2B08]|uniref:MFS transporter n=1 Tax=Nostocoides sp. F2B08 TaxID=2653936 RepID=UPI001263BD31|nr:MFS transporter [Tetrasphaera sp. F2B08]KAB7745378.1 MFS transporter [Tetrasphaera sp. F2B08]
MTAPVEEEVRGLAAVRANVRDVWVNRNVRRLQLAFIGSEITDWAYAMALLVWAYQEGGAALVGTWAGVRALLAAFAGPVGGAIADRMSRRTFMMANDAVRLVLVLVIAAAIHFDLGVWAVLVPGTLLTMVAASFRPAQGGLLPSLVESPKQLTSANATAEIVDSTAAFIGPAIAGVLLGVMGIVPVVLLGAFGLVWSLLLVSGVHVEREADTRAGHEEADGGEPEAEDEEGESFWAEATGGFRVIFRDRDMVALSGLLAVNGLLAGVLMVLVVIVAAEMIGDPNAVGWLNAILGVATITGGLVMLALAGRVRLGRLMVLGVLGWCVPLVLLGLVPEIVVIVAVFVLIGLSDPMVNVGFGVIPPRLVPDRVLSRVFAAIESQFIAAASLGAFLTPVLISIMGLQSAVVAIGVGGLVVTGLCALRMPHLDSRLVAPRGLDLLREVPLFSPLTPSMVEQMARTFEPRSVLAGDVIVREGEVSDLFYVIESGEVEVTQDGRLIRTETVGDVFGEIGLLRDVPRTATVTALTDTELLTLSREEFLALMSGERRVRALTSDLATRRQPV